jgi:hypothetical protein
MSRHEAISDLEIGISRIEMRSTPRYRILQRCFVHLAQDPRPEPWRGVAYNISAAGIGLTLPHKLDKGTELTIQPWKLPGACSLQVRVVRATWVETCWFTGCELLTRLSEPEVQIWCSGPLDWVDNPER